MGQTDDKIRPADGALPDPYAERKSAPLGQMRGELRALISQYVRHYTEHPALQLVDSDFQAQDDIANLLVLHCLLQDITQEDAGAPLDEHLALLLEQNPAASTLIDLLSESAQEPQSIAGPRILYCAYVFNLANWACVSLLSASYLSAFVITRSLLEALVTVGSTARGPMSEKIRGLAMLAPDEQKIISECWRELCGWAHSYRRWIKRLCPVLVAKGPLHHSSIAKECISALAITTDLAYAVAFERFNIHPERIRRVCDENLVPYERFLMLGRRLSRQR